MHARCLSGLIIIIIIIPGSITFVARLLSLPSAISSPVLPEIGVTLVSIYIACEVDLYKIQGYYECTFVYK